MGIKKAGYLLKTVALCIMDLFQPINLDHIAIQEMELVANKCFLNCSSKMLVHAYLIINMLVFKTKEQFVILQTVITIAEF
jgi:hypothetical protein